MCGLPDFARVIQTSTTHTRTVIFLWRDGMNQRICAFETVLFQTTASRFFCCDDHPTPKVAPTFLMPPAFKLRFLTRSKRARQRSKHWRNMSTGAPFQSSQHLDARERFFALLRASSIQLIFKYSNAKVRFCRCRVSALFAVGCVDSPHAMHLLNPDT